MTFRTLFMLGDTHNRERVFLDKFVKGINQKSWKINLGERFGDEYPKDARIELQPQSQGLQLGSFLGNIPSMLVFAPSVRAVIEQFCADLEIQYLPFTLYDHRKHVMSSDYCIVHPIGTFDCLDFKASEIVWDDDKPNEIIRINGYVLDPAKAKSAPPLFRLTRDPSMYIFRSDLAEAIDATKPVNIVWEPVPLATEVHP